MFYRENEEGVAGWLALKPDDGQSSIPGTLGGMREPTPVSCPLTLEYTQTHTHKHTYTHVHTTPHTKKM